MWITLEITLQAWTLTKNTSDQSDSKWAETLINSKKLLQSRVSRNFVEIIVYFVCVSVLCFAKIWTLTKEKTLLNRNLCNFPEKVSKMADFDAIYQDQAGMEEGAAILDDIHTTFVPDPIIVRGAGNITV